MPSTEISRDEDVIRALIKAQFDSIDWAPGRDADWGTVHRGFEQGAQLWPARRPARPQSSADFTDRLRQLRDEGTLESFTEKGAGCHVWVVGNVAIALAGCEMVENGSKITRDVSGFLLVKDGGEWRIAAQAWDYVDDIPAAFAAAGLGEDG